MSRYAACSAHAVPLHRLPACVHLQEGECFAAAAALDTHKALVHIFFAQRNTKKIKGAASVVRGGVVCYGVGRCVVVRCIVQ